MAINSTGLVMHIPHASTVIPEDVRGQFVLSAEELRHELGQMTDWYTDELFGGVAGFNDVVFPVSRLVVDPERFADDEQEPMAEEGMGVVYQVTSQLKRLRHPLHKSARQQLLDRWYHPHHKALNDAVRRSLELNDRCLILDAHSFPKNALLYETVFMAPRPEICIGTDDFHTSPELQDKVVGLFRAAGFYVGVNTPFAGAIVPLDFYRKTKRVSSLMIEVRRDLYLEKATAQKREDFEELRMRLRSVLLEIKGLV